MTKTQLAAMQQALEAIEADIATYTDHITLRRDEAQRVLSAIDWINRYGVVDKYAPSLHQAEIALRAALAEPEQRKPLTDEEIVDAVRNADLDWHAGWSLDDDALNRYVTLIRAVERAHGITGGNDE